MHEPPARVLWVAASIGAVAGTPRDHRAVLTDGDTIVWTGADPAAAPPWDRVEDLGAAHLLPGFVDAHVHGTATGLGLLGLRLADAGSAAEVLERVAERAAAQPGGIVYGTGWDDTGWPERRPPSATELAEAAPGCRVLLVRVDGHSAVVDTRTLRELDLDDVEQGVDRDADGEPTGWLIEEASGVGYRAVVDAMSTELLAAARSAACEELLSQGITTIHEMGIPALGSRDATLAWVRDDLPVNVVGYWAALELDATGELRPGGDLFLDGSIGSCTAGTTTPYRCGRGGETTGVLFHDDAQVADFFTAATAQGVGAGVHAIGDAAIEQAVRAIETAAQAHGAAAVRAAAHRIEHLELATPDHARRLGALGVVASVQPAFDATWNGPGGLYTQRFGAARARTTNPLRLLVDAGMPLALSSDSPVTPIDPWGTIVAAERHHGALGITRAEALAAHIGGGHVAAGQGERAGRLAPGQRADLVAWPHDPLEVPDPCGMTPSAVVVRGVRRR